MGERFTKCLLGLTALVLLASGCAMVGPDYVKPPAPEPKEWIEKEDPQIKSEPTDFGKWWTLFNDPVLDGLIETAYKQNLPLRIAGIRILQARAVLGIATGTLYPQQQAGSGSYTRNSISTNDANIPPGVDGSFGNYNLGFDATWELDFWGRFRRAVESSLRNLEATVADYDDTLVAVTAEVARTYVVIRTLEERLVVARENVKIQERSVQIARVRFEGGDVSELDVTQATSLLKETEALIPRLEAQLRQTKNALAILLGILPGDIQAMLSGPALIPPVPAEVAVGMPAELLRRRPDIRSAERQMASQSARIGVAKSDPVSPGISSTTGVSKTGFAFRMHFSSNRLSTTRTPSSRPLRRWKMPSSLFCGHRRKQSTWARVSRHTSVRRICPCSSTGRALSATSGCSIRNGF